jgi:hypothetical protein
VEEGREGIVKNRRVRDFEIEKTLLLFLPIFVTRCCSAEVGY